MESARCSVCGINYPAWKHVCEVRGCGERLSLLQTVEPDVDWSSKVRELSRALEEAQLAPATDELRVHRVSRFAALGFPEYAAELLADARDAIGFPLWWGRVDDALRSGATHSQALRIFV